jgi:hypothetical protein
MSLPASVMDELELNYVACEARIHIYTLLEQPSRSYSCI